MKPSLRAKLHWNRVEGETMNFCRLTLCVVFTVVSVGCEKQRPNTSPVFTPASSPAATVMVAPRYQIVFSPHVRADTFLLDTQKGRVWVMVKFSDIVGEPSAFDEVDVIDSTGEIGVKFSDFTRNHEPVLATGGKGKNPAREYTLEELEQLISSGKSPEPN
jgi:hypothetical protein